MRVRSVQHKFHNILTTEFRRKARENVHRRLKK